MSKEDLHKLKMYWEYEIRDKDGKVIKKGKFKSKSWTGRIVELLYCLFHQYDHYTATLDTSYTDRLSPEEITGHDGTKIAIPTGYNVATRGVRAPAGETFGIAVGSDSTPVSIDDYYLKSIITHGTGSGQLEYGGTTLESLTRGDTYYFRVIRTFTNNSGADVVVREVGLILEVCTKKDTKGYFMIARDVPSTEITVPDGKTLTLRYVVSYTL